MIALSHRMLRILRLSLIFAVFASVRGGEKQAGAPSDPGRVALEASAAKIRAERLEFDKASGTVLGLMRPADSVEWDFRIDRPGWYQVIVHYALTVDPLKGAGGWEAQVGDQTRLGPIHATGSGDRFLPQVLFDPVQLGAGNQRLKLALRGGSGGVPDMRIRKVEIVRAREPGRP